jgi:tetratricopeptide (TPR) repeat protein
MKRCPFCSQVWPDKFFKCEHCGSYLKEHIGTYEYVKRFFLKYILWIILIIVGGSLLYFISTGRNKSLYNTTGNTALANQNTYSNPSPAQNSPLNQPIISNSLSSNSNDLSNSFTINVPNSQGGYTAIVLRKCGDGFKGPQEKYFSEFPSVAQLQATYGTGTSNSTGIVNANVEPQAQSVANNQGINQPTDEEKEAINNLFRGDEKTEEQLSASNEIISRGRGEGSFSVEQKRRDVGWGYFGRGDFYRYNYNFDQAISDYTQAIAADSNQVFAYQGRGKTYYLKGDYAQAIANFTEAIEHAQDVETIDGKPYDAGSLNALSYQCRGIVYFVEGEYAQAIDDFNNALHLKPTYGYSLYFKGRAYDHLGDHWRAIFNYNKAIQIEHRLNSKLSAPILDIDNMVNSLGPQTTAETSWVGAVVGTVWYWIIGIVLGIWLFNGGYRTIREWWNRRTPKAKLYWIVFIIVFILTIPTYLSKHTDKLTPKTEEQGEGEETYKTANDATALRECYNDCFASSIGVGADVAPYDARYYQTKKACTDDCLSHPYNNPFAEHWNY